MALLTSSIINLGTLFELDFLTEPIPPLDIFLPKSGRIGDDGWSRFLEAVLAPLNLRFTTPL